MFKKCCSLILAVLLCLSVAACGEGDAHTCSGESWTVKEEATCEKDGLKEQLCSCGKVVATEAIPASGHTFVKGVCNGCGAEDPDYVPGPSEGLMYTSNGDGTCMVASLGTCTDKDLVIPDKSPAGDTVVKIGNSAFKNHADLHSVEIPGTVTNIDESAFEGCAGLKAVSGCAGLKAIGKRAFKSCAGLTTMSFGNLLFSIESGAFSGCTSLTGIQLPSTLKFLRAGAFLDCAALTEITIPDPVTHIEDGAFTGCTGLKTLRIGSGVEQIGERVFKDCANLSDITFGEAVSDIGEQAFANCTALKIIVFPERLSTIREEAFTGCTGLTELVLPEKTGDIQTRAFANCTNLAKVTVNAPYMLKYNLQFLLCPNVQLRVRDELVEEYKNSYSWQEQVVVGHSSPDAPVGSVGLEFSSNNDGTCVLVGRGSCTDTVIRIPEISPAGDTVIKIGDNAFSQYCGDITEIIIPSTVTELGRHPFEGCHGLTKLDIPASVTAGYADMLFDNDLTELTLRCEAVMSWPLDMIVRDAETFYTGITIFVPENLVEAYRSASGWGPFGENIQPIA